MTARRQILIPVVLPIMAAGLLVQSTIPLARILTTYAALDLGFGPQVVGMLSAAFAILPIFLTVMLGRVNDRGGAATSAMAGAVGVLAGCVALWLVPPSLASLLIATTTLGIGQTLVLASMQLMISRSSSRMHRDAMLGNYMVAISLGQAVGPLFIGSGAGFVVPVIGAVFLLLAVAGLLWARPERKQRSRQAEIPLSQIAATKGLPWLIVLGSICVASQDLILAFLPVLGAERDISPAVIGILLSVRAVAAMLSRIVFSRMVRRFGRMSVTVCSSAAGGVGLLALGFGLPVWALGMGLALTGFGVGMALTSTVALTLVIAPPPARGTALSLRLTANRIAQFTIPLVSGLVIAPLGAAGVLAAAGAALTCAAVSAPRGILTRDAKVR
ncbi:MFS transporter [Cereibacter sp. SYSU M97828]|nr:MFS transporter [Cereibacter flavus]